MKKEKFLLIFLMSNFLFADKYYIRHENGKEVVIIDEYHQIISNSLNKFLLSVKKGDILLFKRGEVFKEPIKIEDKEGIIIKDYGLEKSKFPIIDTRYEIKNSSFKKLSFESLKRDKSWNFLESEFRKNTLVLKSDLRDKIAKNFKDVQQNVYSIYRAKIDLNNIDPNAMRVWVNGKEILKALIFEEFKNLKDATWFYEKNGKYLYIFVLNKNFKLSKVKINNRYLDSLSIQNSKDILISHLDIRGSKYALSIRGSKNVKVKNSKIGLYSFSGIEIMKGFRGNYSQNISIENNVIDSGFRAYYRYLSSRGAQDGIFLLSGVSNSEIVNNEISNWGHSGINLYAPKGDLPVKNNKIYSNFIQGNKVSYMHGVTVDGVNSIYNKIKFNIIRDITARNQINGIGNIFSNNAVFNVKNSPVKIDQGYFSAQGVELQAYSKDNISKNNLIENNIFAKTDGACISLLSLNNDGMKEGNIFKDNILINCGLKNNFIALKVKDNGLNETIKKNYFINNIFKSKKSLIFYRGDILNINEFNEMDGKFSDKIKGNRVLKEEEIKRISPSPLLKPMKELNH